MLLLAALAASCSGGPTPSSATLGLSPTVRAGGRTLDTDVTNQTGVCALIAADYRYEGKSEWHSGTSLYIDSGKTRTLRLEVDATGYPIVKLKADVSGTPDCSGGIKMRVESISDSIAGRWTIKGLTAQLTGSPGNYRISQAETGH